MAISYNKLWKILIDITMRAYKLIKETNFILNTVTRIKKSRNAIRCFKKNM